VGSSQKGSYVFVVKPDHTAEQRNIQVVRTWRDLTVVAGGLNPGEQAVVKGQLRLKPGTKVEIVPGRNGESAATQSGAPANP
jgi:multidrug efflux system membrane fusion protein